MPDKTFRGIAPFALAAALVGWSFTAGVARPWRSHPVTQALLGSAVAGVTRAPLGLRPPELRAGLRLGLAAAAPVALGVCATTAIPAVRAAMADRDGTQPGTGHVPLRWLALEIPVGTVWSEEMAFRGALASAGAAAFGPVRGRLLQSIAFGLSHVADARLNGEPVLGTVIVTAAAGWVFGWLRDRSGSLVAPMLVHLAVNEAGAAAVLWVRRQIPNDPGRASGAISRTPTDA